MNDASSSTSDQPPTIREQNLPSDDEALETVTRINEDTPQQKKRVRRDQKAAMLDHLIRNIDITFYAHLSVLYYMDCSLINFVVRASPHWFYFTPKPSIFPPPPVTPRPYVGIIFGLNLLCLLRHLVLAPPAAGEATRGYLHGGLLIDFVGQKSPVGRWKMMILDLLILALQVLMLGITLERRGLRTEGEGEGAGNMEFVVEDMTQDHDSEERGMLRQDASVAEDIEMQELRQDPSTEPDSSLQQYGSRDSWNQHPLDPYYTGEHIVANLHLIDTIQAQWRASGPSISESNASNASGVQVTVVAAAAGRTLNIRLNGGTERSD